MPMGKGTYGSKRGRPPKKKNIVGKLMGGRGGAKPAGKMGAGRKSRRAKKYGG